jgi:hypothetical protein
MATFEIIKDMDSEFHDKVIEVYHRCLPSKYCYSCWEVCW